jgi:heat shock protein HtpX
VHEQDEPVQDVDASTLHVNRRRNRVRLFFTLVTAVFLYWLAVMIAAVVLGLVLALKVLAESGEIPNSLDELKFLGIGLAAVAVIAAIIGSLVAAFRLPLQRRRLEQQVLAESAAKVIDDDDTTVRRVRNILDALAIAAHIPRPRFAVVEDPAPNSFAVGTRPKRAIVAVTRGAIDALSRDELEAILAYEVSRIGSWDVALSSWTVALTGAAMGALDDDVSKLVGKLPFWASGRLRRWAMRDAAFERDKAAVRFTRNPTALLHALEAIGADPQEVQRVSAATAPLWFEVPARVEGVRTTLDERIAALKDLGAR